MKYLGAYLLASLGGKASPSAQDILNILGAGSVDCDMDEANKVIEALSGKTISEVISEGKSKMASVPSGGAASAAPAAASAAAPAAAAKKEEPKEESDEDMGFGLFD